MRNYEGNDNYGKPKSAYLEKLTTLSDEEFVKEIENKIWLSAFASNNPRSDYHWHTDACYDEAQRREKPELYEQGYNRAKASCGY